jgi:hypothetical protein
MGGICREMLDNWLQELSEHGSAAMTAYPKICLAILGVGLAVGWSAAWLILRNRLAHWRDLVDHYEKVIDEKIPGMAKRSRPSAAAVSIWLVGILVIVAIFAAAASLNNRLGPRHLSAEQARILTEKAKTAPSTVVIIVEGGCQDCPTYANDIQRALRNAGWDAMTRGIVMGPTHRSSAGVVLETQGRTNDANTLKNAFDFAKVGLEVVDTPAPPAAAPSDLKFPTLEITIPLKD